MIKFGMRLFKRESGIWYVQIQRGVKRSLDTKDEREARIRLRSLEREALKGKLLVLDAESQKIVSEFLSEYAEWVSLNRAKTSHDTLSQIIPRFNEVAGNKRLSAINKKDMDNFVSYCRQRGNKPVTINIAIRTIKAAFTKAAEWGYITENRLKTYKLLKYHKGKPQFIRNEKDVEKIFDIIGDNRRYRLIFALYIYTGARRGEIHRLEWKDVKKDHILFRERKNYEQLEVPIVPKLRSILDAYPRRIGRIVDITLGQMSHSIKEYLRRAGLKDLRPHDLRHTFASQLLMAGVDITTVQRLLGHSNVSTTSEFYGHITEEHKKAAINKLPY